jgi:hypothetical protein
VGEGVGASAPWEEEEEEGAAALWEEEAEGRLRRCGRRRRR